LAQQPLVGPGLLPICLCWGRLSSNSWPLVFACLEQHHPPIAISVFQHFLLHLVWCWMGYGSPHTNFSRRKTASWYKSCFKSVAAC
jgi:hypothetical protein